MKFIKNTIRPIFLATVWISISEFVRNEFIAKSYWIEHYDKLGLKFPSEPLNGVVWGIWSLFFAVTIFLLLKKFTLLQTTVFSWFVGFVMMWVVTANLLVFPLEILPIAVPLSILEAFVAAFIIHKLSNQVLFNH